MRKKFSLKIICACLVASLLLVGVNFITKRKYAKAIHAVNNSEKLDVLFLGGSHGAAGFMPSVISEKGISSYNYCTGGQPMYLTYYWLKEIDKRYDFDTIVLDIYYTGLNQEYFFLEDYVRNVVDNIPFSPNKVDMINACASEERLSYYLPFLKYHSRWNELGEADFFPEMLKGEDVNRGFDNSDDTELGLPLQEDGRTEDIGNIPKRSEEYLEKIVSYADENDIRLVFVSLPHQYKMNGEMKEWVDNEYALFNGIRKYADERKIDFIELNDYFEEMEFDFPKDMKNEGHVNVGGAKKISDFMSKYLEANIVKR